MLPGTLAASGKGKAPGPAPKGNGKGMVVPGPSASFPPKGKGKAVLGPPPPRPVSTKGTGTAGKGNATAPIRPPASLQAPRHVQPLNAHYKLNSVQGSLWEGLGTWAPPPVSSCQVTSVDTAVPPLQCFDIDYDRLRDFWALPPPPEEGDDADAADAPEFVGGHVLDAHSARVIEIAMRSLDLTPMLIQRALTEDFAVLSAEQAIAIEKFASAYGGTYAGLLQTVAAQIGVEALGPAESLLHAITSLDQGMVRVGLLGVHFLLQDDIDYITKRLGTVERLVNNVKASRSLRTALQAILVISNVLSQKGCSGLKIDCLRALPFQKVGQNLGNPTSIMELTVEMLESTHMKRCRLRFWRLFAVGRCPIQDTQRQLIWSYLDDLEESPWDVLPLLRSCDPLLCSRELQAEVSSIGLRMRSLLRQQVQAVETSILIHPDAVSMCWRNQFAELKARIAYIAEFCDEARHRTAAAALHLACLFGTAQASEQKNLDEAAKVLHNLRCFGASLGEERRRQLIVNARHMAATRNLHNQCGRLTRIWAPVDTRQTTLQITSDLDLIRAITEMSVGHSTAATSLHKSLEGMYERDLITGHWKTSAHGDRARNAIGNLMHGGPEGNFVRDPATGRWVNAQR